MNWTELIIKGISYSQTQTGAYALILEEMKGDRKLPIIIGSYEAQSIALAMEKEIIPPRPLTHDLFVNIFNTFQITFKFILIYKLLDGVFYSYLFLEDTVGNEIKIDSRTSDAIALSVRFAAPIFASTEVLKKAGIIMETKKEETTEEQQVPEVNQEMERIEKPSLTNETKEELERLMKEAVRNEDYEKAAKIRDQLDKLN